MRVHADRPVSPRVRYSDGHVKADGTLAERSGDMERAGRGRNQRVRGAYETDQLREGQLADQLRHIRFLER